MKHSNLPLIFPPSCTVYSLLTAFSGDKSVLFPTNLTASLIQPRLSQLSWVWICRWLTLYVVLCSSRDLLSQIGVTGPERNTVEVWLLYIINLFQKVPWQFGSAFVLVRITSVAMLCSNVRSRGSHHQSGFRVFFSPIDKISQKLAQYISIKWYEHEPQKMSLLAKLFFRNLVTFQLIMIELLSSK